LSARLLHQIPGIDKERFEAGKPTPRGLFCEDDDYLYFYADYSQIELVILAYFCDDKALIGAINDPNRDIHTETAVTALKGKSINYESDFNRTHVGKRINFGISYGSHGSQLAKGEWEDEDNKHHIIGKQMARDMVELFRSEHPQIVEYLDGVPDVARAQGLVLRSVFGRERVFHDLNHPKQGPRQAAEREAVNFTIQSPAGDITIRTINRVHAMLEQNSVGIDKVRLINSVHDSVAYGVRKDYIDWFSQAFKAVAMMPVPEVNNHKFEIKMGWSENSWAEAEINAS
jgi:DNA polymerase-1